MILFCFVVLIYQFLRVLYSNLITERDNCSKSNTAAINWFKQSHEKGVFHMVTCCGFYTCVNIFVDSVPFCTDSNNFGRLFVWLCYLCALFSKPCLSNRKKTVKQKHQLILGQIFSRHWCFWDLRLHVVILIFRESSYSALSIWTSRLQHADVWPLKTVKIVSTLQKALYEPLRHEKNKQLSSAPKHLQKSRGHFVS